MRSMRCLCVNVLHLDVFRSSSAWALYSIGWYSNYGLYALFTYASIIGIFCRTVQTGLFWELSVVPSLLHAIQGNIINKHHALRYDYPKRFIYATLLRPFIRMRPFQVPFVNTFPVEIMCVFWEEKFYHPKRNHFEGSDSYKMLIIQYLSRLFCKLIITLRATVRLMQSYIWKQNMWNKKHKKEKSLANWNWSSVWLA